MSVRKPLMRLASHALEALPVAGPSRLTLPTRIPPPRTTQQPCRSYASRPTPSSSSRPVNKVNPLSLRDGRIPFKTVQLVDPDSNVLQPPESLHHILTSYDHSTHTLALVSVEPPIVRLINIEEERQKQRISEAKLKLSRRNAIEEKEVQISWSSAEGDLKHKIELAKSILEKGDRATIIYANKAGSKEKIPENLKDRIKSMFEGDLEGIAERWKDDEPGKGGAYIQFWGPEKKIREERKSKLQEDEVAKRKERDEKKEARRRKEEERKLKAAQKV